MPSTSTVLPQIIAMNRIRTILSGRSAAVKDTRDANPDEYEPLRTSTDNVRDTENASEGAGDGETSKPAEAPFSWLEYTIFALVGVAMLWAW